MYYVYVLKSLVDGSHYTGLTKNIEKRLNEHNKGKTISNRRLSPFVVIHVEIVETLSDARKLEKFLKSGFGREIINEIDAEVAKLVDAQS